MGATLRELRERRASVAETMKITKAMELIAASRVTKAQAKAVGAQAYTMELHRAVAAVATFADVEHPLTIEHHHRVRSAVLVIGSDRGLAGGYPGAIVRAAEGLINRLRDEGVEAEIYTSGRKVRDYFAYHEIPVKRSWSGFSEAPHYEHAREIGETLMEAFRASQEEGGVCEIHVIYTRFRSMVSQQVRIVRLLPLEIVEGEEYRDDLATVTAPDYTFEPSAERVLDALLPMYVIDTLKYMLRQASASELSARQQAMHAATDNASELIHELTRQANAARQAEITQEINEIVGGAGALAEAAEES